MGSLLSLITANIFIEQFESIAHNSYAAQPSM